MPAHRHPLRHHIMTLFRRGELSSVAEAVVVTGISRQVIGRWLRHEHIDVGTSRLRHLARLHDRLERVMDGKPPRRRPTKAQMRKQIADAIAATPKKRRERLGLML